MRIVICVFLSVCWLFGALSFVIYTSDTQNIKSDVTILCNSCEIMNNSLHQESFNKVQSINQQETESITSLKPTHIDRNS